MSCLEAQESPMALGGHCFHQKTIKAVSFWAVTGGGAGWGQSTVLGQWALGPVDRTPAPAARGGQLLRLKPQGWPRAGELAARPGGRVACPLGLVDSRLQSWATPHLWGGRVLQTGLRDRRAQPMESPTCRERRLRSNSHGHTRTRSRGARSV